MLADGHDIRWMDDGGIGYECRRVTPMQEGTVFGVNEGDKVIECASCGMRLKATWHIRLEPTDAPVTEQ